MSSDCPGKMNCLADIGNIAAHVTVYRIFHSKAWPIDVDFRMRAGKMRRDLESQAYIDKARRLRLKHQKWRKWRPERRAVAEEAVIRAVTDYTFKQRGLTRDKLLDSWYRV